jgi:hypothetical protein
MGAQTFTAFAEGKTAKEAFSRVVDQAQYDYGHSGYTGTIAEKTSFVIIQDCQTREDAYAKARELMDDDDDRISDKWGPAGAIRIPKTKKDASAGYLFFGWASS